MQISTHSVFFPKCNNYMSIRNAKRTIHCIPQNWGYYGSCTVIVRVRLHIRVRIRRDFFCSTYKPHISWDSFETFQVVCHDRDLATLLVAQKSKLCSGESKTSKNLTIACIQAIGHSFFHIYLSTGGIRWILWFSVRYAAPPAMHKDFWH